MSRTCVKKGEIGILRASGSYEVLAGLIQETHSCRIRPITKKSFKL